MRSSTLPYILSIIPRFLVLHGMPGSGKTVLAAETMRDPDLVINTFHGGIFWVKVNLSIFFYLSLFNLKNPFKKNILGTFRQIIFFFVIFLFIFLI